jgi:predicted 2-oxoglutarate/Fe(II)-dependent dioxygenase YbiX/peroxiredoxin
MRPFVDLKPGDPGPWFHQRSLSNPRYAFDTAAGRYLVLCLYVTGSDEAGRATLDAVFERGRIFDDVHCSFFGVSIDPNDAGSELIRERIPGIRFFLDYDGTISRLYGAIPRDSKPGEGQLQARRLWVILDPTMRVLQVVPFQPKNEEIDWVFAYIESLPPPARFAGVELQAPILYLPNVFDTDLCRKLIDLYESHGGEESGFMREEGGKTVAAQDYGFKRRKDYNIEDQEVIKQTQTPILRAVVPEIMKIHQFRVTRMERYIVSCYSAEDGGHFRPHRDNTTKGTAHRRFAVSINLNDDFEGGEVSFPEYGPRSFKAPVGGAVVFSCSLLHAVSRVTRGQRYAFLPFVYDDAAARLREQNRQFLADDPATAQPQPQPAPAQAPTAG